MAPFRDLCLHAQQRGLRVLVTIDENAPGPRITYDTIDLIDGPPNKKKTKLVDRERVVDGKLDPAAVRLLDRVSIPEPE